MSLSNKLLVRSIAAAIVGLLLFSGSGVSQGGGSETPPMILPPFDSEYTMSNLGAVPGVPNNLGGLTFLPDDPNTVIIGGTANGADGALYAVAVSRDVHGHITGFVGPAEGFAPSPYIDGGLAYGPDDVLFVSRFQESDGPIEITQIKKDSTDTDKLVDLSALGVTQSPGGLNFVPPGFPGEGLLKVVSYEDGAWYTLAIAPDGNGTFDVTSATLETSVLPGAETFVFVPAGMPLLFQPSILLAEYDDVSLGMYELDDNSDPILSTRRPFATGIGGPVGLAFDPLTGDVLVSQYLTNEVLLIEGFTAGPGDVNCDGRIDGLDALLILKVTAGLEAPLAPGCLPLGQR